MRFRHFALMLALSAGRELYPHCAKPGGAGKTLHLAGGDRQHRGRRSGDLQTDQNLDGGITSARSGIARLAGQALRRLGGRRHGDAGRHHQGRGDQDLPRRFRHRAAERRDYSRWPVPVSAVLRRLLAGLRHPEGRDHRIHPHTGHRSQHGDGSRWTIRISAAHRRRRRPLETPVTRIAADAAEGSDRRRCAKHTKSPALFRPGPALGPARSAPTASGST